MYKIILGDRKEGGGNVKWRSQVRQRKKSARGGGLEIVGVGGRDSRMKWNWKMTDSGRWKEIGHVWENATVYPYYTHGFTLIAITVAAN